MRRRRPSAALVVAIAALVIAVGGSGIAALAAIPQDGRFTACYQTSADLLNRIVVLAEPNEACPSSYARVTWGQSGAPGPAGPAGPAGPQGPAGPSGASGGSSSPVVYSVVERRVTLRSERDAVARCAKGWRAVGGGGVIHSTRHEPLNSYPLVEKRAPVGWAFRPAEKQSFAIKTVDGGFVTTQLGGFPTHRHKLAWPPLLYTRERRGFARQPATVTVYAICTRALAIAKPKPTTPPVRAGS